MRLPTTRKKGVDSGFSVEASIKDGSAECARNQRSYGKRYRGLEGATAMAKAQRSYGNDGGENRGEEKNDDDSVTAFKGRPGSQRKPRRSLFPRQRDDHRRPRRARNAEEGRWPCSLGGEHCSLELQNCHWFKIPNYSQICIQLKNLQK